jgi:hypothetical protein
MISLDALALTSDLLWIDEYTWTTIAQQEDVMADGSVVIQAEAQQTGRPITLLGGDTFGWVKKSVVESLKALAETPNLLMTLTLNDASTFTVVFTKDRFTAATVCDNNNPDSEFLYTISLYLMVLE